MKSYLSLFLFGILSITQSTSLIKGNLKLTGFLETDSQVSNSAQLDAILPIPITKEVSDDNEIIQDIDLVPPPLSVDCNNGKCSPAWSP